MRYIIVWGALVIDKIASLNLEKGKIFNSTFQKFLFTLQNLVRLLYNYEITINASNGKIFCSIFRLFNVCIKQKFV